MKSGFLSLVVVIIFSASSSLADAHSQTKVVQPPDMGEEWKENPPQCYPVLTRNWKPDPVAGKPYFAAKKNCTELSNALGVEYFPSGSGVDRQPGQNDQFPSSSWKVFASVPVVPAPNIASTESWLCGIRTEDDGPPAAEFTCYVNCCQAKQTIIRSASPGSKYMKFQNFTPRDYPIGDWPLKAAKSQNRANQSHFKFDQDFVVRLREAAKDLCVIAAKGETVSYGFDTFWSEDIGHFHIMDDGSIRGHDGISAPGNFGGEPTAANSLPVDTIKIDSVLCVAIASD